MSTAVLVPFSYLLIAIFIGALVYRVIRLVLTPIGLRWELASVFKGADGPANEYLSSGKSFERHTPTRYRAWIPVWLFLKEALFLKTLLNANKKVWLFSYPMHLGLYCLVGMVWFALLKVLLSFQGISLNLLNLGSIAFGFLGCVLGVFGASGLILTRLINKDLRRVSTFLGFFNLLIIVLMLAWRWSSIIFALTDFLNELETFLRALLTANTNLALPFQSAMQALVGVFCFVYVHVVTLMHFVAIFMSYMIRCDNRPLAETPTMPTNLSTLFDQPVAWAAPHIRMGMKQANWRTVTTDQ